MNRNPVDSPVDSFNRIKEPYYSADTTQHSFLSLSSGSSLSSASTYYHQSGLRDSIYSRDSVDFTTYSQHHHPSHPTYLLPGTIRPHAPSPTAASFFDHSIDSNGAFPKQAYANRPQQPNRSYSCYKQPPSLSTSTSCSTLATTSAQQDVNAYLLSQKLQQTRLSTLDTKPSVISNCSSSSAATLASSSPHFSYYQPATETNPLGSLSHLNNKSSLYRPTHSTISHHLHKPVQEHASFNSNAPDQESNKITQLPLEVQPESEPTPKHNKASAVEIDNRSTHSDQSDQTSCLSSSSQKNSWRKRLFRKSSASTSTSPSLSEPTMRTSHSRDDEAALKRRQERFAMSPQTSRQSTSSTLDSSTFGLVSRGEDTRLRESPELVQEYFESIQARFLVYCSLKSREHLDYALSITPSPVVCATWSEQKAKLLAAQPPATSLGAIEMSLRQLREATLTFTPDQCPSLAEIFVYSVKLSAMEGHHEAYIPSVQHIINVLHPEHELPLEKEFEDILELYILHLVHFNNDTIKAFDILGEFFSASTTEQGARLWEVTRRWLERDYVGWRLMFNNETDLGRHRIMAMGDLAIAKDTLNRVGASYQMLKQADLESIMGMPWSRIKTELHCAWPNDDGTIVIKARK